MYKKRFPIMSLFLAGLLILAALACGGTAPAATEAAADEESAQTGGAVSTLEGVQQAVIQIEYLGSYRDPAIGAVSGAGFGSGFIIDSSGIAVTNNHVVAGAASLKIRIGGDTDKTYNAKILGVSECSDLAVIDIEGEGFPYLNWYDGEISVGMNVYAVGFPLGEPEYTMTRGVVSKASASGETAWASIDGVIGHDATINPGNSGGPLVTEDGKVVGVNYRSRPDYDQYFAISVEKAVPLSAQLREGENVDSIGVNGQAVVSDDKTISGVWVSSVVSGSAADKTGIQGGDVIVSMEGVQLAKDGTLADYCDVLRSHNVTDTLAVNVLRFDTQEGLEGQLNGAPLAQAFSFAAEAETATEGKSGTGSLVKFKDSLSGSGGEGSDKFTMLAMSGGEMIAYVQPEAGLDVSIVILDSNNKSMGAVDKAGAGEAERLSFTSTGDVGVYSIFVMGKSAGNYEGIFIGSEKIIFTLMPNYLIAGNPRAGDSVGYAVTGHSGETLDILVTSDSKNPIDASIRIFSLGDLKTALAEANGSAKGGMEILSFSIPKDDVYIVFVDDASGEGGSFLMATKTK
jgi:S1-C subfamily serine protease